MYGRHGFGLLLLSACFLGVGVESQAASVKSIILAEVDPGGANGTSVLFYDELTPEQISEFSANYDDGQGYLISPVATLTRTVGDTTYAETRMILLVPIEGGAVVVPMAVTCSHSGCKNQCTVTGCHPTTIDGQAACTGASCTGGQLCGNPTCSKTESTARSSFVLFGSV